MIGVRAQCSTIFFKCSDTDRLLTLVRVAGADRHSRFLRVPRRHMID
jgi:hypothetical protein